VVRPTFEDILFVVGVSSSWVRDVEEILVEIDFEVTKSRAVWRGRMCHFVAPQFLL
jgi:hypothetical protein